MIDETSLKTLESEIGSEDFAEVVSLFLMEMDEAIENLPSSQTAGTLGDSLHFLKGASLNLGLTEFSALCVSGEVASKEGQGNQVNVGAIAETYQNSRAHLEAYLAA